MEKLECTRSEFIVVDHFNLEGFINNKYNLSKGEHGEPLYDFVASEEANNYSFIPFYDITYDKAKLEISKDDFQKDIENFIKIPLRQVLLLELCFLI